MEVTKEQKKVINRYKIMPSFLQSKRFHKSAKELIEKGLSEKEASLLIFQNSSKNVKVEYFEHTMSVIDGIVDDDKKLFKELMQSFRNLSLREQDKILESTEERCFCTIFGETSLELQEKYFSKFLEYNFSRYFVGDINENLKKANAEVICERFNYDAWTLDKMWEFIPTETKPKYYEKYLQQGTVETKKWGEIDEKLQQEYMPKILEIYEKGDSLYSADEFWDNTKDSVKQEYLSAFGDIIRKKETYLIRNLKKIWEKTNDNVQNSDNGIEFFRNASKEERKELYEVSNSKLQGQVLAEVLVETVNSEYSSEYYSEYYQEITSDLKEDLYKTKYETFETNFENLFKISKQNITVLNIFLGKCPVEIKEKYSSIIEKYFSTNLESFVNYSRIRMYDLGSLEDMLINSAYYLNANSSRTIMEKFFDRHLENRQHHLTDYDRIVLGIDEPETIANLYWKAIKRDNQKEIYVNFIENDKLEEQLSNLYNLMNFENFEDAKLYFIKYFEKYNPEKKEVALSRLEKINEKNNTITATINFDFIASDLIDSLTEEQILRITQYSEIQKELVKNKSNRSFINAFAKMLKTDENWTLTADYIFKNIDTGQYNELLLEINENEISPEYYDNLCIVLSKPNYFGITSKEDVEKYFDIDGKRNQMLLSIMQGENVELPDSIKGFSQEELKKFAISEYLYGMDLEEISKYAIRFQGIYGLEIENSEYIKQLVTGVSNLNNANEEELDKIITDIIEGKQLPTEYLKDMHLDSKAINLFRKSFERGIYKPEKNENDQIQSIDYNDSNINVYRIHDDFKMLARVEGAYNSELTSIPDYREFYDNPNISAHGNCESVIGQDQIGLARNRNGNIVVGYALLPQNSMLVSAPYDLATKNRSLAPLHDNLKLNLKFYGLQEMIDNTRHTHNETVMERVLVDEHGSVQKLRPSYLIWVEDRKTDKFPPEFIEPPEDNENAMEKYKAQVHLWEETQRAAQELGIPIVIINREECAEKELAKVDEMKKILKGEVEIPEGKSIVDIAREAITKFENNAVGLEFAESDVQSQFFTQEQREDLMDTITNVLVQMPEIAYEDRMNYLRQITDIITQESEKFSADGIRANDQIKAYYDTKSKTLQDELIKYQEYIGKESEIDFSIPEESKETFETYVRTIAQTDYYEENKAHSIEHIEKVMLFSLILAENEGLDHNDTKILLTAAAFHDSFRSGNDGSGEHAIGSAQKAKDFLVENPENSYDIDSQNIPLIQVAIEYHEFNERIKGKIDRTQIQKLCEKYGYNGDFEKAVQISSLLKDADALDRERFGSRGKLNSEYLRSDSAKSRKMILFAQKINGVYAKKMIGKNYEVNEQVDEFNAVKILQAQRRNSTTHKKESTLSVDEMLELFYEVEGEYTKAPTNIDKKKNVIKAFEEVNITGIDIIKAENMLGINDKVNTMEETK